MRARTLLLVIAAALVAAFAYLNWPELSRPTPVNLGWTALTAPMGLILLGLLALGALAFLASGAAQQARHAQREREQAEALQAQRDLADRAEASRFVDLRKALDEHLRDTRDREKTAAAERDQALARTQRDLRSLLEQMHRALTMTLGEMEARLDARIDAWRETPPPERRQAPRADQAAAVAAGRNT